MAIKIPSKNIYEMQNPKVRDNVIDNVKINNTKINKIDEIKNVYEGEYNNFSSFYESAPQYKRDRASDSEFTYIYADCKLYYCYPRIVIQKLLKNSYIRKLLIGVNGDNAPSVRFSFFGDVELGNLSGRIYQANYDKDGNYPAPSINLSTFSFVKDEANSKNEVQYSLESIGRTFKKDFSQNLETLTYHNGYTTIIDVEQKNGANIQVKGVFKQNQTNDFMLEFTTGSSSSILENNRLEEDINEDTYVFEPIILCGIDFNFFVSRTRIGIDDTDQTDSKGFYKAIGEYYKVIPKKLEISISGMVNGIDLTDNSLTYGSGNKPYSLNGNELLQDSGVVNKKTITEHIANNILNEYKYGKETAIIRCSISDYYDENDNKLIDIATDKMSFRLHDEVIPYVFGADGQDKPMSKYQDGSAKVFEVVGSNIIYDGAVWQELTLLEKKQENT